MANVLPFAVRVRVIRALVEGVSIRATSRITGADKDVVMRLGATVGRGCMKLHDRLVRNVSAAFLEVDETWAFVGRHEKRKLAKDPPWFGDQYTMFALDADTKLVAAYKTGKRTLDVATEFMHDLRARVDGHPQISVDGWPNCLTRLTNAYSRKKENLVAAAGLHYFWYNFVREHESLSSTPAVSASLSDHVWTLDEMVRAALEEMGEMNRPTFLKRGRRVERKTHTDIVC